VAALLRIGGQERQRSDRGLERSADAVVDANRLQGLRIRRLAGLGVTQHPFRIAKENGSVGRLDEKPFGREGREHVLGGRMARHRELLDRFLGFVERVGREPRERVVDGVRPPRPRKAEGHQGEEQRQYEESEDSHGSSKRGEEGKRQPWGRLRSDVIFGSGQRPWAPHFFVRML
jgi:hypothetical protein